VLRFKSKKEKVLIQLDYLMREMSSDDTFDEYLDVIDKFTEEVLSKEVGK
jgi:hypothetical protein